jgi:hypothetical protein
MGAQRDAGAPRGDGDGTPGEEEGERAMGASQSRKRKAALRAWVTPEERAEIEARAEAAGLSLSAYLRVLGLGHEPRSMLDQDAVLTLAKVNADQGRLGGLLKLWLSEKPQQGASTMEVRRVLRQVEELQAQLKGAVERL